MQNLELRTAAILVHIKGKIEILSTNNLCRKFAVSVCRKIATTPQYPTLAPINIR